MLESQTSKNANEARATDKAISKAISDEGQVFFRLATLVILVAFLYFARAIFVPFALAVLLTFVLVHVVVRLDRLRLKRRQLGRPVSMLIVILCLLTPAWSVGWMVKREFMELTARWPEYRANIANKLHGDAHFGGLSVHIPEPASLFESAARYIDVLTTLFAAALLVTVMPAIPCRAVASKCTT